MSSLVVLNNRALAPVPEHWIADEAGAPLVDSRTLTMRALEVVWVPGAPKVKLKKDGTPKAVRGSAVGPNGEGPDKGRWQLRLPAKEHPSVIYTWDHLGKAGGLYEGPALSPSGMETASECMHKFGLGRIDDVDEPPKPAAERGKALHGELQGWLQDATAPPSKGMAKVIEHFPMPGQTRSETYFGYIFGRPGHEVVIAGYMDAREQPAYAAQLTMPGVTEMVQGADGEWAVPSDTALVRTSGPLNPVIRDLKTTGDWRWKKTPAKLRANLQGAVYALDGMLRASTPGNECRGAVLFWVYAHVNAKGEVQRVETVTDGDDAGVDIKDGSTKNPQKARGVFLTKDEAVVTIARYVLRYGEAMIEAIRKSQSDVLDDRIEDRDEDGKMVFRRFGAQDLPKNVESCGLYGGCGFKKNGSCTPPSGGGFLAQMRQKRLRAGVGTEPRSETGLVVGGGGVRGALAQRGVPANQKHETRRTQEVGSKRMGLKDRYATNGGTTTAKPAASTPAKPAAAAKPAGPPVSITTEVRGGLKGRYGTPGAVAAKPAVTAGAPKPAAKPQTGTVSAGPASAPKTRGPSAEEQAKAGAETVAKINAQATEDGQSATGAPSGAPAEQNTVLERLKVMANKGAPAAVAAIVKAVADAPVQKVGVAVGALSVGINPPDVAREWTTEELAAEAARLAGEKAPKAAKVDKAAEPPALVAATDGAPAAGAAAPKRAGRPAKPKPAAITPPSGAIETADETLRSIKATDSMVSAAAGLLSGGKVDLTLSGVVGALDAIAVWLTRGGHRSEAAQAMALGGALANKAERAALRAMQGTTAAGVPVRRAAAQEESAGVGEDFDHVERSGGFVDDDLPF